MPTRMIPTPYSFAACTAPAITEWGALSPPMASTAIFIQAPRNIKGKESYRIIQYHPFAFEQAPVISAEQLRPRGRYRCRRTCRRDGAVSLPGIADRPRDSEP